MERVFFVGASGHAKTVLAAARSEGRYDVAAVVDDGRKSGESFEGIPILGPLNAESLSILQRDEILHAVVCIGDNFARKTVAERLVALWPQVQFATITHSSASVAPDTIIGAGSVVMPGAIIQPGAVVGAHCILNTKSSLDHDSSMGDFSTLAPGATVCGKVTIGAGSVVCAGATVIHRRSIGSWTVIGAGATVVRDVPDLVVAYGVPCRVKRARKEHDPYM